MYGGHFIHLFFNFVCFMSSTPTLGEGLRSSSRPSSTPKRSIGSQVPSLRTLVRAAPLLAALLPVGAAACGSATVDGNVVNGCSPIPDCPPVDVSIGGPYHNDDYYLTADRWTRTDPNTGNITKVCDPTDRDFCEGDQTPQTDGCELPVCENAKACDPIPSRPDEKSAQIALDQANLPVTPVGSDFLYNYVDKDPVQFPVVYDNAPDCPPDYPIQPNSYLTCDPIPTCDDTFAYCRPLPRCAEGESPITCEDSQNPHFSTQEECVNQAADFGPWASRYGLNFFDIASALCIPEVDPNTGEDGWALPAITVKCLPTPECAPGEIPANTTLNTVLDCNKWGKLPSSYTYAPSCDPVKSCPK